MPRSKAMPDIEVTPVSIVLQRIAAELGSLAAGVDQLQDSLGPLLMAGAAENPHAMVDIQALDSIAQTLASLSGFVADIGDCDFGPRQIPVDELAERLPLSDLADRLRGRDSGSGEDDFEMF